MERIAIDFTPKFRRLTPQELAEKPTSENLEQIKVEAGILRRNLRTKHLSRIGPSGVGLHIICK